MLFMMVSTYGKRVVENCDVLSKQLLTVRAYIVPIFDSRGFWINPKSLLIEVL